MDSLFALLKHSEFKNIQLITHQSDKRITKRIYNKKPSCISKWYAINVDVNRYDLISIPIGLANLHPKNINLKNFENEILSLDSYFNKKNKEQKLFLNFQISTNYSVRSRLYKRYKNKNWVVAYKPNEDLENYSSNLKKYSFILCPEGNGIDTHRVWEALYSGSIPVLKYNKAYKYGDDLPVIFLKDYNNLNIENLNKMFEKLKNKNLNLSKLTFVYWSKLILNNKKLKNNKYEKYSENIYTNFHEYKLIKFLKLTSKLKIIRYFIWKVRLKINLI